jgi:hypothetical protein
LIKEIIEEDLLAELQGEIKRLFPSKIIRQGREKETEQAVLFPLGKGSRRDDLKEAFRFYLPRLLSEIIGGLHKLVSERLQDLTYLGPLRSYPPRHLAFSEYHDQNWKAGGGYAWDVLRKNSEVREKINDWLGDKDKLQTPYRLVVKDLISFDDIASDYAGEIEDIEHRFTSDEESYEGDLFGDIYNVLDKLKKNPSNASDIRELNLVDLRTNTTVSHRDVGIGISQIIPVLVSAYASQNKIIAIEQPEIHLHPKLQAEIGDVFVNCALQENYRNIFILETHSEHTILRILRRIRETTRKQNKQTPPIRPDDVSLIFIDANNKGAFAKSLRIDNQGRILDRVPGGFFEEDFEELF